MPRFPSDEWIKQFSAAFNAREQAAPASQWAGDMYCVVLPEGALKEPAYLYVDVAHGKCREARLMQNPAEKKPAFVVSAPLGIWRNILQGKLHPIPALARQLIQVEGSLVTLMSNVKSTQALLELTTQIPTEFPE